MPSTAFRTTANHQEAIDEGLNSVLRYQNFINNPNTSLTGLKLMVITPQSSSYTKVQNKKQKAFEDKRKEEGKEINGIYAVVVDENNNLVVTDTSGEIIRRIEPGELEGDIDNELEGILVTTLVSNAEQKESGFNAVSYQNFGRENGIEGSGKNKAVTEEDIKNKNHPAYIAWNAHKQSLAFTRQGISEGNIKYLKIEDSSAGIFQNSRLSNPIGETLGIDVNDSRLSFVIPKVEDITSKEGITIIGKNEGLNKDYTVKVGKPYLIYNGKLFPLNARKLSGNEVENVAKMFELAIANPDRQKYFLGKIKELVYIKSTSMQSILNGELKGDDLRDYLRDRYRQVDATALQNNPTKKYQVNSITDKGVNPKAEKSTYRDFILAGNEPAITINYNPHPTTVKDSPNYLNGYLVYSPVEEKVSEETKTEAREEPKQVTVEEVVNIPTESKTLTLAQRLALLNAEDDDEEEDNTKLFRSIKNATSNRKENITEAKKWFEDRFNGESFEVVDSLLNGNAFGEYTQAATRLFKGAEEGTIYHEAFHKVTQEYLTSKQVKSLYDAVRKNVNNKFSDLEAEEWLAEEFRKFVLGGQKAIKNMPYTNNIFRKLYNWIKSLVTGKTTPQQIFDKLASKKGYTGAKKFNNAQFTKLERPIPNTTHAQTRDIISSVNGHFFRRLFAAGYTPDEILGERGKQLIDGIYARVFESLKKDYKNILKGAVAGLISEEELAAISQHYELMLNIQDGVPTSLNKEVQEAHIKYLQGLGIAVKLSDKESQQEREAREEETEIDEADKVEGDNAEADDRSRDSAYDKNSNEESSINSAPNSIKLLVMSLPQVDKNGQPVFNNIGGPALNDYLQTMKLLYSNLNGLSQFHEMWDKMQELSPRFPVFKELMNRLGEPGSNKELNQFLLENDFRQAFSKFESRGTITLINPENGEVYQVDANANKLRDRIKENWTSNLRVLANDKNSYIKKQDDGFLALDKSFITDARAGKFKGNSKALFEALGVTFTDLTQEQVQAIPNIKDITNTVFKYVAKAVEEGKTINDLFSKDADIRGQMNLLLDVEVPLSKETVELSYISAEGKRIYAVSLNNYYSLVVNALNNSTSKSDLFEKYPHLNNPYTQNSVWIKNLFNDKGNKIPGQRIYMNTVSGLKQQDDNDSGIGATKMEPSDKIVQEFNDLLTTGATSLIRAADKSSEYAFGINNYGKGQKLAIPLEDISKEGFETSKVHEVFFGYFNDELARIRAFNKGVGKNIAIYNKQAGDFSLFADILSPETLKSIEPYKTNEEEIDSLLEAKINKELVAYLESYAKDTKKYMQDRKVGLKSDKGFTGISTAIATTEKELDNTIKTFTVNHLVNMIEQSKLLIGDSAFYKDKIKRISSGTGTKKFAASSKLTDNWLNNFYKNEVGRVDEKIADGKLNVVIFDDVKAQLDTFEDYVQALVDKGVSEEKANEILAAYKGMDEGDAQGWITLDEYREFFMRVGGAYWTDKHEAQYRYERALEAKDKNQELTPWMIKALEKNPEFYFMPIKAQHMGPQVLDGLYAPAFHKYSLSPLYHSLVKGRNMEKMLDTMRDNKVGYALFGSGSKVGTPLNSEGKLPAFYNKEGELSAIQADTPIQQIYYENLGIQLDIAPKVKESLIFGSQTRKLLFSNIFGENVKPEFQKLGEEYNKLIDNLVTYEFDKLTKKLGLKVSKNEDGSYKSFTFNGDYRKLVNQLKEQLEDKDTADNILDSLQVNEDGSLKYPIDSMVNRSKIESMLFTIVNSKVIKQKMNGNSLVQLASSGFENTGKREVGQSNYLKFYTNGKQISSSDKVIFGHPTIGKTFLKDGGEDKFISLDDDYAQDIKDFIAANKKANEDKYQYQERKPKEFIDFTLELFDKAKERASKENKQLFTSNNILLDKRGNEFDKVVDLDRKEFFKRIAERNTTYDVKAWKDQIDSLIAKVDSSKVIKTSGYLSDLFKDGKTTAMEVEIPMNKNFQPLLDKYKTIEGVNKAIAEGKIDAKHLQMIGYRIPTQGLNSMDVMTIKRFMPSESGIAIILPTGVVAKSGGDYDIDKLNIFMPNLFYDEKSDYVGDYRLSKNSQGQDYKKSAQNKIIDIMSEVLTHPDNFIDLTTPNTTDDLVNLTAKIREAQGKKGADKASMTKQFRFDYLMEQFTYFLGGKAALGIAATHNTHHVVSQIAGVKLNASLPFKHNIYRIEAVNKNKYTQSLFESAVLQLDSKLLKSFLKINDVSKELTDKEVLELFDRELGWMYRDGNLDFIENIKYALTKEAQDNNYATSLSNFNNNKDYAQIDATVTNRIARYILDSFDNTQNFGEPTSQIDLGQIYTQGGQKITDIINQFINAYVDVAKDPFYKDLNAGTEVSSVWMYMLRAGVDLETIGYFMTQPIILEYVNARKLNKSLVTTSSNSSTIERILSKAKRQDYEYELMNIGNSIDITQSQPKLSYADKKEIADLEKRQDEITRILNLPSLQEEVLEKYGVRYKLPKPDFTSEDVNEKLKSYIKRGNGGIYTNEFKEAQSQLLNVFFEVERQSGELTKLMQATNNDTTKIQNYGSVYKREQAEAEVRDTSRKGNIIPAGTIEDIHKKTIVGSFNKTKEFSNMYKELTLYTKYPQIKSAIDKLVSEIPSKSDWDKEYTKIQNDFIGYLLQKYGKTVNGESISSKVSLLSGDNSLAKQLIELRKENLIENNPLFDELVGIVSNKADGLDNVKLYSRRMSAFESNIMTEAFRSMLDSNNPRIVEFAQNLAYATILQSGLQNSPITFTELIPFDFYNNLADQAIKSIEVDNQEEVANEFTKAYYHNKNSKYGFRLQDYGIKEGDALPEMSEEQVKEDKVLPQQDDSVLDTTADNTDTISNVTGNKIDNQFNTTEEESFNEIVDDINNNLGKKGFSGIYDNSPSFVIAFPEKEPTNPTYLVEPIKREGNNYRIITNRYNILINDNLRIVSTTNKASGKTYNYSEDDSYNSSIEITGTNKQKLQKVKEQELEDVRLDKEKIEYNQRREVEDSIKEQEKYILLEELPDLSDYQVITDKRKIKVGDIVSEIFQFSSNVKLNKEELNTAFLEDINRYQITSVFESKYNGDIKLATNIPLVKYLPNNLFFDENTDSFYDNNGRYFKIFRESITAPKLFNPSATQNTIRETNKISNISQEDGDSEITCKIK